MSDSDKEAELKTIKIAVDDSKVEKDENRSSTMESNPRESAKGNRIRWQTAERVKTKRELMSDDQKKSYKMRRTPTMSKEVWQNVKDKDLYPIQVRFEDLTFSVLNPKKKREELGEYKTILSGITGSFEPGSVTAIMGSSGAGKTTLLNVLAGRAFGKIDGKILYNGYPREESPSLFQHQAYVMQDDIMMPTQTAREIITFSAKLRISNEFFDIEKYERVEDIIDELNIRNCENTQVGAPGVKRGVSGGERKRIAVGVELVTNPSLLFLDEPTSGLDSFTAQRVVETMQTLAKSGRTIVCTIHQPNSQIFAMLDNLILLAKGRMVYNGPVKTVVDYFGSIGHPVPQYTNPADYLMELIHIDQSGKDAESEARVRKLIDAWPESDFYKQKEAKFRLHSLKKEGEEKISDYAQGVPVQSYLIAKRSLTDTLREPLKVRTIIGQTLFLSILLGLIYLQIDNDATGARDRSGALFFILINQAMAAMMAVVTVFPSEKIIFLREHNNHMYRTTSFFLSKIFAELPFQILYVTLFSVIVYWMVGFQKHFDNFIIFWVVLILVDQVGESFALLLGIGASNGAVAVSLVPIAIVPFMIFSGYLLNTDKTPPYFIWIEYISFFRYAFRALTINEFKHIEFHCRDSELIGGICPVPNGTVILEELNFDNDTIALNIGVLIIMYVALRLIGYGGLIWKAKATANA